MAGLKAYLETKVTDKHGKIVSKKRILSKSFLVGFLGLIEGYFRGAPAGSSVRDILNSVEDFPDATSSASYIMGVWGADDDDSFGLVVGTGTTAPDNMDYKLETLIAHGVAATQLDYGGTSYVAVTEVGANIDLQILRTFTNSSGGDITVEEVGIYAIAVETGGTNKVVAIIRDVTGGILVANGQTLTLTYTLRTTV